MTRRNSLTDGERLGYVKRWVDTFRSEAEAARSLGMKRQQLNAMTNGDRPFSEKVLNAAGVKVFQPPPEYYPMDEI
ncbi:MAG: hypothetical protein ABF443_14245 [Acetobacter malorum]|uniref:Uncharacterized protein n=1 Tax=Acetobacter orientalis TaxID=146474 RepID=A0A252B355_9PROT|nr:hypothetical protein [Acetobacter orientalis]OUI98786.1 hypothetical protein HK15_13120 [Acetobacter orientalis]